MNRITIERENGGMILTTTPSNTAIARGINEIMDFLENDLKKEIESIIDQKINDRFEILDL
jgi:hypothetical protein